MSGIGAPRAIDSTRDRRFSDGADSTPA